MLIQMRAETLWRQLEVAHREATTLSTELQCFTALHHQEQAAAPRRIEALTEELGTVAQTERVLQKRYEGLAEKAAHLRDLVAAAEAEAAKGAEKEAARAASTEAAKAAEADPANAADAKASKAAAAEAAKSAAANAETAEEEATNSDTANAKLLKVEAMDGS